jgi:phage baseplate assembly protein W
MTPLGELTHLGHPDFGSRLHLLIGRLINASTIALAKAYVREALRQEPRVERVDRIDVRPDPVNLGNLLIEMAVRPVAAANPVRLAMTFALEPGQVEANTNGTTGG